jgi:CubicO group peptidase (beta-lactamase class C family)
MMAALREALSLVVTACLACGTARREAERSDDKASAAVDEVFADFTTSGSPGCALGVFRDGKIIYSKGYGLANIENSVPIAPQTVFDIGSTSKQFTASSILLLEKQGKLSVHDEVRKYLPELGDAAQNVTILHMLNHTSGLRDYLVLMELAGTSVDSVTTDDDALALISRQKALNFAPGSEYLYSNTGFFLLSLIVKRVSGKNLHEFAAENIFGPLGMNHTQYRDDHTSLVPNRALAYEEKEKKDGYVLDVSYFEQTGDGAVHTSIEDLQKWDENFYASRVGGKDFLAELQEPGKLNDGKTLEYAKGLFISDYRGLHTVSHGGAWGGYRAELLRFPEQHFSVACLCNVGNSRPTKRAHQVADVYLASLMKPKDQKKKEEDQEGKAKEKERVDLKPDQLKSYTGEYWSEELGALYRLGIADAGLTITGVTDASGSPRFNNFRDAVMRPTGKDELEVGKTGVTLHFLSGTNAAQALSSFTLDAGRTKGIVFQRRGAAAKSDARD